MANSSWMISKCILSVCLPAFLLVVILFATIDHSLADIDSCPSGDDCSACEGNYTWSCVVVPPGSHDPSIGDEIELVKDGYKGLADVDRLTYRVVFHNNTAYYPADGFETNVNKLFGFSRGFVQVMDRSCMFGWRKTLTDSGEPAGKIVTYGYGWVNSSLPPWTTPGQMPEMVTLDVEHDYIFDLKGNDNNCTYDIYDGVNGTLLASTFTPEEEKAPGLSYFFILYFGGTETTTEPVTVSYSMDVPLMKGDAKQYSPHATGTVVVN